MKLIRESLIKFIPGVGKCRWWSNFRSNSGGVNSRTWWGLYCLLEKVSQGELTIADLQTDVGKAEIAKVFKERLSVKRDKSGKVAG